jgi:hypothetical protein
VKIIPAISHFELDDHSVYVGVEPVFALHQFFDNRCEIFTALLIGHQFAHIGQHAFPFRDGQDGGVPGAQATVTNL